MKITLLLFVFIVSLNADLIQRDKVIETNFVLQVSSCKSEKCVDKTTSIIKDEMYFTNKLNTTYIVNIKTKKDALLLQSKYKEVFPDTIIRRRYSDDKKTYKQRAYLDDFYINKNYKTKVNVNKITLYDYPNNDANKISTRKKNNILNIDGCNIFSWCKLKNKKLYIRSFNLKFVEKIKIKKEIIKQKYDIPQIILKKINTPKPKKIVVEKTINKYKLALELFQNKQYEKSYHSFDELFKNDLNNVNINFYLARSAFETKRYHEALIAYERVLFDKPDNIRAKLEMARTYFVSNSLKKSKQLFIQIKNTKNLPQSLLKNIEIYLNAIDSKIVKHSINGVAMIGLVYDSNINSSASIEVWENYTTGILNLPVDENNTVDNNKEEGWAHQEVLILNYKYKASDSKSLNTDLMAFSKNMFKKELKSKNVQLLSLTQGLKVIHSKNLDIDYALFIDNLWIDKNSNMLTYGIYPKVKYKKENTDILNGYLKYQVKSYNKTEDKRKNTKFTELFTSYKTSLSQNNILTASLKYAKESKKYEELKGAEYTSFATSLSLLYSFTPTFTLTSSLTSKFSSYKDIDDSYLVKPKNKEYKLDFSTTYVFTKKDIVQSNINYTLQNSNIPLNEYEKYSFGLNYIRLF